MHFKSAALLAAVAATAASASSYEPAGQNQVEVHRQFLVENDKICVTKHQVTFCDHGFKPIYEEDSERYVEMYCLDKRHPKAHSMASAMENGNSLKSMHADFQTRRIQLPKVKRCANTKLTKDGQVEDFTTEYEQRNGLRPKSQRSQKHQQKFQGKQEREQQYQTVRSKQQVKLQQLKELMPTIEQAVQLSESDYEKSFELIKKIARDDQQVDGVLYQLQNTLPEAYADAVQRVQDELIENMSEEQQKQVKEQLKKLASRVYIYTLTRLANEQQKQPISEQIEAEKYNNWQEFEKQFERVWEQIKRDAGMDSDKIEKIERQAQRKFQPKIEQDEQQQLQSWQLSLQTEQDKQNKQQTEQEWEQQQPQQWQQDMTRQQRERQQMQLTKIIMAGLKTAEKQQKEQPRTSAFSGMFNKKVNYEQLVQQTRREFQNSEY